MAKKTINLGTPNGKDGDVIRDAFGKVNDNFNELYALTGGTAADLKELAQDYAAPMFTGGSHTSISASYDDINNKINLAFIGSSLNQSLIPSINSDGTTGFDLGSPIKQWRSLYVSEGTIFLGGTPLSVDESGNILIDGTIYGGGIGFSGSYNDLSDKPTIPSGNSLDGENISISADTSLDLDAGGNINITAGVENDVYVVAADFDVTVNDDIRLTANDVFSLRNTSTVDPITIITDYNISEHTWSFNSNGSLTFPDNTVQSTAFTGTANIARDIENETSVEIKVNLTDSTTRIWRFGEDGDLVFPDGSTQTTAYIGSTTGDLTITIPGNPYKGFGARYGRVYNNGSSNELTVSKIVIYKQAADTASTIDPTGSEDNFAVTGLSASDVVAMFILYGDTNGAKDISTLRTFAQTAIDTVILNGGVQGSVNTISAMRSAFYTNIGTLTAAAGGLVANFQFYTTFKDVDPLTPTTGGSGTGFKLYSLERNQSTGIITMSGYDSGLNYQVNDVIVVPGNAITNGTTPENNISITITQVGASGEILDYTVSGNILELFFPANNISDGGNDQYDNANYINTNLANNISYNQGNIVDPATVLFGAGSKYVVVYDSSIFAILATDTSVTEIRTSGNSGADGSSVTDTDELFATDKTYDPGLTNLNLTNKALPDTGILFVKENYATANDVDVIEDDSTLQIGITRGENQGIYNPFQEESWDQDVSPAGTLWNIDGWDDLSNLTTRTYTNFYAAYGGNLGNRVPGSKAVMYVPDLDEYYAIQWLAWTQNGNGGGFSYLRYKINKDQAAEGIRFADGTVIKSAAGLGRVKATAENNRRIEEVTGYKNVEFTAFSYATVTGVTTRAGVNTNQIYVARPGAIYDIADNYSQYVPEVEGMEFSLDNTTWYRWNGSGSLPDGEFGYNFVENPTLNYNQGDTVYLRYQNGGFPVVWWDTADLPGGASRFRGAVIDYHAYDTYSGTIIGTIHIVNDSGENHITHTEVNSGSSSLEYSDLWFVQNEGTISYRRLDGNASRLKIQWTAKVFYGSEFYD